MVATISTSTQNELPPSLHLLKTVAAKPISTQNELTTNLHLLKTVAAKPTSTQRGCRQTYIYSTRLRPNLHLLKTAAAKPASTQNGCRQTYIYSKQLPPNLHLLKKRQQGFTINEIGKINSGRGFQTGSNVLRIGRNIFYDWKNKIWIKIPEFKRSGIRIIAEFCGNLSGFPNHVFLY
jgi:hypothetical protein